MTYRFETIEHITLFNSVLKRTRKLLRKSGCYDNEAFVLWAGKFKSESDFTVNKVIYPEQTSFQTENGIGVYIDGKELFRISQSLYKDGEVLLAQVHSHPTEAYHSKTDDLFPIVTAIGQFSIVVPYFAREPIRNLSTCAVYRLNNLSTWIPVDAGKINNMVTVVKDGFSKFF